MQAGDAKTNKPLINDAGEPIWLEPRGKMLQMQRHKGVMDNCISKTKEEVAVADDLKKTAEEEAALEKLLIESDPLRRSRTRAMLISCPPRPPRSSWRR
jgi:hypothetical protein